MSKAVILLSGGVDSATALYIAKKRGYECYSLIFDYGQRHKRELKSAKAISKAARSEYKILKISLPWQGSSILDKRQTLPAMRSQAQLKKSIPSTYVPARNTIFLSFAASYAEAIGARKIFIGANSVDFSGYPDCRKAFIKAFEGLVKEGTKAGNEGRKISIEAPLLHMTKAEIIKEGRRLKVPYQHTWSCYAGQKQPCLQCDSCRIRSRGFEGAGSKDPLLN